MKEQSLLANRSSKSTMAFDLEQAELLVSGRSSSMVTEEVLWRKELPGVTILEQCFSWKAGQEMSTCYDKIELYCRLHPYNVECRGWADTGNDAPLGRLSLFSDRQYHARAGKKSESVRVVCCQFDKAWLNRKMGREVNFDRCDPASLINFQNSTIERSMRRLVEEVVSPGLHNEEMIRLICEVIVIDLVRYFQSLDREDCSGLSTQQLERISSLLKNEDEPLPDADEIARDLGMSRSYLSRLFRDATGDTLFSFIEDARFARACALLQQTDLPLKVISFLTGYRQHSTFSFAFKRRVGQTPKAYRQRMQTRPILN